MCLLCLCVSFVFLEAQADPGRATRSQKTALHLAVRAERLEMMRLFLEKDVTTSDRNTFASRWFLVFVLAFLDMSVS